MNIANNRIILYNKQTYVFECIIIEDIIFLYFSIILIFKLNNWLTYVCLLNNEDAYNTKIYMYLLLILFIHSLWICIIYIVAHNAPNVDIYIMYYLYVKLSDIVYRLNILFIQYTNTHILYI